ncbi:hypothetical protein F3Y22_tig00111398pilonHSYRG00209 [Hibiscus syriacus]|uniref:Uncharacterized protein n=1 Tax=Hibiscus syriacus TaxID=106335 RepID=A0A6A2Y5S3_HIBSY|nr:uncharacterized protein LOC120161091 [Hibiscus syriacus]KAE8679610.1 hypothetical protein F3Y22_tig00111398pilonHSYRG00209 [Hibiscus syriacus]
MGIIRSKAVDVSSFFLFEATGDSESGGSFDAAMADINGEDDDDDAESCSCETVLPGVIEIDSLKNKFANIGGDDVYVGVDFDDDDEDDDGVVEQREVQLYKKCCRNDQRVGVCVAKEKKPSTDVSVENSNETMNETEKNRLFWEACLAS